MILRVRASLGSFKSSWLVLSLLLGCRAICDLKPVSEGAQLTTITHDGVPRSWYTYVPASVAAAQAVVPLVVDLHGLYTCVTNGWLQTWIGWISKAEEFGFILVWPQAADEPIGENGVTGGPRWNAGVCDECLCKNCVYVGQGDTCCRTVGTPAEDSGGMSGGMCTTGGTAPWNSQCAIPFEYDGTTYSECTTADNNDVPWCYTRSPTGTQTSKWGNCQACDSDAGNGVPNANDADDVGFLREVVAQVAAVHPVDTTRIYVTGHSQGCFMAQRVLAQASDLVAAVACFAGGLALSDELGVYPLYELSSEYTPRPLMVIHGNADLTVAYPPVDIPGPYLGPGAEANLALWGGYNGCPGDAATETIRANYTLHEIDCNGVVSALVELPGVGHYPLYDVGGVVSGFSFYDGLGTAPFDTTQLAWDFLKAASINDCPAGCVSVNSRQRRQLLFGSIDAKCPKGCVPA